MTSWIITVVNFAYVYNKYNVESYGPLCQTFVIKTGYGRKYGIVQIKPIIRR